MKKQLCALAVGAIAGGVALALPTGPGRDAGILPATVSPAAPVRVVSTALDEDGRPVVTVRTATDRAAAARLVDEGRRRPNAVGVELDAVTRAYDDDPYRSQQWNLDRMNVPAAWPLSTGAGVTVAVLDTGVDAAHPDLAGHMLPGYDAINGTIGGDTDPNGHGTHVAGTIAALTGNGDGIAGVAADARILPIRVLGASGSGFMSDAAEAIVYAADHGADVINMSLGATERTTAVSSAVAYARGRGVVIVAAAGNERTKGSPVSYPAADNGVIAVAATDANDTVASFSNRGGYVDVAAPGSRILSTYPTALGGYKLMSGTSMAAPHVSAVAALLKAYRGGLTPDQVEQALETSAVDLGPTGRDDDFGHGRIDAAAALTTIGATASPTTTTTAPTTAPTTVAPTGTTPITVPPATTAPTYTAPTYTAPTSAAPTIPVPPTTAPTSVAPTTTAPKSPTPTLSTTAPTTTSIPAITLSRTAQTVTYRATATATFRVTTTGRPYAGRPAQLCLATIGWSFTCTPATTTATGTVTVARPATTLFRARLLVPGATTSPVFTASVRVRATLTRVASGRLRIGLAGVAGQRVQLQRRSGNRWVTAGTYPAAATRTVTKLTPGAGYRVVVPNTTTLLGMTTGVVKA